MTDLHLLCVFDFMSRIAAIDTSSLRAFSLYCLLTKRVRAFSSPINLYPESISTHHFASPRPQPGQVKTGLGAIQQGLPES
jgi:hypothetical protein